MGVFLLFWNRLGGAARGDYNSLTGDIPTRNVGEGLIIEANLQTQNTQTGLRVGSVSVASLNATQYKHHVIDRTWKFPGNHAVTGIRP